MIVKNEVIVLQTPKKSENDQKEYKLIKLSNGLKVLLVRNHIKDNSSAVALCVDAGSFLDPPEVQGLSHFLEHMVSI
jgi:secreted Zn-dependent insulinase-like peptidase